MEKKIAPTTEVEVMEPEAGFPEFDNMNQITITGYDDCAFQIDDFLMMKGSILALQNYALCWKPETPEEITMESLAIFHVVNPKPDILFIGTGKDMVEIDHDIILQFREKGIAVEVMTSKFACGTFAALADESRNVAAAILQVPETED